MTHPNIVQTRNINTLFGVRARPLARGCFELCHLGRLALPWAVSPLPFVRARSHEAALGCGTLAVWSWRRQIRWIFWFRHGNLNENGLVNFLVKGWVKCGWNFGEISVKFWWNLGEKCVKSCEKKPFFFIGFYRTKWLHFFTFAVKKWITFFTFFFTDQIWNFTGASQWFSLAKSEISQRFHWPNLAQIWVSKTESRIFPKSDIPITFHQNLENLGPREVPFVQLSDGNLSWSL